MADSSSAHRNWRPQTYLGLISPTSSCVTTATTCSPFKEVLKYGRASSVELGGYNIGHYAAASDAKGIRATSIDEFDGTLKQHRLGVTMINALADNQYLDRSLMLVTALSPVMATTPTAADALCGRLPWTAG